LQRFFGDQQGQQKGPLDREESEVPRSRSLGSGFFIYPDGYILTNYHVVNEADEIIVRTSDRREFPATVIGKDQRSDTALIKIDIQNAPVVEIGDTNNLEVGAWVLAIGSPFGFDHSVTQGIVSALGRNLPSENYVPFIQTDVAINPGNSGGPLIDLQGKVVGINSQIYSRTGGFMGLSFAIPIDLAMNVARQLKTSGHVSRGWLGVMIQDVSLELAETFGMTNPKGAVVVRVLPNSPAANAGIKVKDVILSFNGRLLSTSGDLPPLVGTSPVNRPSTLRILRNGRERDVQVTIGELPEDGGRSALANAPKSKVVSNRLGLTLRNPTAAERQELDLKQGEGAVVKRVTRGVAKTAGLRSGDVILMFDNEIVRGAAKLQQQIDAVPKGSVAVLVQRGDTRLFVVLQIP
jgi:serine protease Do